MTESYKSICYSDPLIFNTGNAPATAGATSIFDQFRWLFNWRGNGQIFTFSGPGPYEPGAVSAYSKYRQINPDIDYTGNPYFAVITRADESEYGWPLGGILIPWRYQTGASVDWQYSGGESSSNLFTASSDSHEDLDAITQTSDAPQSRIQFWKGVYHYGVSGGGFAFHKLSYSDLMVAGLGIWTMPDLMAAMGDTDYTLVTEDQFLSGRQVRGADGTARLGIGHLIGSCEALISKSGRCLLQSGHPTGVATNSASYVCLRNGRASGYGQSSFLVQPRGLYRDQNNRVTCTPAIVARALGASVETPAYIRYSAIASGSSCVIEVTEDTEALYTAPAGLEVYRTREQITIEMQAPENGSVALRTYSLWED